MGSYIHLGLGELEVDWCKNSIGTDYSKLFLPNDLVNIPYYYADDEVILQPGYSKKLKHVMKRLELLGYSLGGAEIAFNEYKSEVEKHAYPNIKKIDFKTLLNIVKKLDVTKFKYNENSGDYGIGEFVNRVRFSDKQLVDIKKVIGVGNNDIGQFFDYLNPFLLLRLFCENQANLELNLDWHINDVVENGWVEKDAIMPALEESDKFLIVTEGSSDSFIIKKSLAILVPDIMDFFTFVDMEDNYPFTGTGNLFRFCQGLSSINLQNKTLVIFDNDVEGLGKYNKVSKLKLPKNMRIMHLPSMIDFESFPTVGPSGESNENVNGKAVSIECFLDLNYKQCKSPRVRWTNYQDESLCYQGSLEGKDSYIRKFSGLRENLDGYDFQKLSYLINSIYEHCIT